MKPIRITAHALGRMIERGATREQVIETIRAGKPTLARAGRYASSLTFEYHSISPMNHRFYAFKTVEVVWVDEPETVIVVTTKVYYHDPQP